MSRGPMPDDLVRPLAAIVQRTWAAARIEGFDLLAGDASARRYARLRLSGHAAPETVVAMILPDEGAARSEEITSGEARAGELPFTAVGRFLAASGVPVPAVFADAWRDGFLLLEDIGDTTLAAAIESGRSDLLDEATRIVARLAATIARPDPACCAFATRYDRALIGRELEVVHTHGLVDLGAHATTRRPRAPGSDPEVERELSRLGDTIARQPDVLMHRDYHAWNVHLDPAGQLRVIDFQDATVGPALYDLASLLTDRDSDRFIDPALEARLVPLFARNLAEHGGPDLGRGDALLHAYFTAVAYRTLRVIGRFGFLALEKEKPGYLRFVPRMARQTRRALAAIGEEGLLRALAARAPAFA